MIIDDHRDPHTVFGEISLGGTTVITGSFQDLRSHTDHLFFKIIAKEEESSSTDSVSDQLAIPALHATSNDIYRQASRDST